MWSFKPDVRPYTYRIHKTAVLALDFNNRGTRIVSGARNGAIVVNANKVKP